MGGGARTARRERVTLPASAAPRFGIVGRKDAGKTTMVVRLVRRLTAGGLRVATVKHAHHGLQVDREGTDSWKHREAGASEVAVVGSGRWAVMHELRGEAEPTLDAMIARMSPCDLVLVEGFKPEPHPKLELRRGGDPLDASACPNVVAVAEPGGALDPDDVEAVAAIVLRHAAPPAGALPAGALPSAAP